MKEHPSYQPLKYSSRFEPSALAQQILRDGKITAPRETSRQMIEIVEKPPLVNAFKNREIEFGFSLQNIQTVFETFNIQPSYA